MLQGMKGGGGLVLCLLGDHLERIPHSGLAIPAKKLDVFRFRSSAFKHAWNFPFSRQIKPHWKDMLSPLES